jgi:hypothetical protein
MHAGKASAECRQIFCRKLKLVPIFHCRIESDKVQNAAKEN